MNYLIIGFGRTAKNWQHYLQLLNIPIKNWNRKIAASELPAMIEQSSHVLLLISDNAIEAFYKQHPQLLNKICIHFSGALDISGVHSVHPLASFNQDLLALEDYKKIPLVSTSELSPAKLLPGIDNPFYKIKASEKSKYHALCVLSGNFSVLLWQKVAAEFAKLNLPKDLERNYRQMIFDNMQKNLSTALTGPIARKDDATIFKNLDSLKNDAYQKVYLAFLEAHYPEAAKKYSALQAGGPQ